MANRRSTRTRFPYGRTCRRDYLKPDDGRPHAADRPKTGPPLLEIPGPVRHEPSWMSARVDRWQSEAAECNSCSAAPIHRMESAGLLTLTFRC